MYNTNISIKITVNNKAYISISQYIIQRKMYVYGKKI